MSGCRLTESLLRQRVGNGKDLASVVTLDLKDLALEELDAAILNQLQDLEILDVSGNKLRCLPSDLHLPRLRKLDCSDNRLTGLGFLAQLPSLKELYTLGNGLQPADRYIAAALCPDLQLFDRNKPESLQKVVDDMARTIQPDIEDIWEKKFENDLEGGLFDLEEDRERMCDHLASLVRKRHSPWRSALREGLGEFLISHLSSKFVAAEFASLQRPPAKRARICVKPLKSSSHKTPTKSFTSVTPKAGRQTPSKKETPGRKTPKKMETPTRCRRSTSRRRSNSGSADEEFVTLKTPKKKQPPIGSTCPEIQDYDPVHFVRCHFGDKAALKKGHSTSDPCDNMTAVWACQFEPNPNKPGESKSVLATCGGEHVCLIDCSSGHVLQRLHQPGMQYSCLAWTTLNVERDGHSSKQNILAVAGKGGRVELIHPTQHLWYASLGTDRPNQLMGAQEYIVNTLTFHSSQPQWLFAGASDGAVEMWDIGIPEGEQLKAKCCKLAVFCSPAPQVMALVTFDPTGHLVAATDRGLHAWKLPANPESSKSRYVSFELHLPDTEEEPYVDSLTLLDSHKAACKVVSQGRVIVFDLKTVLSGRGKHKVVPLLYLSWRQTDADFISLGADHGRLVVGDDRGTIWMYNLQDLLDRDDLGNHTDNLKPSRMLTWPHCDTNNNNSRDVERLMTDLNNLPQEPDVVINCASISSNGQWVAGTTNNNLVCVWKAVT